MPFTLALAVISDARYLRLLGCPLVPLRGHCVLVDADYGAVVDMLAPVDLGIIWLILG